MRMLTLTQSDKAVRTQITLTKKIKQIIEKEASKKGESLSEYLRKAGLLRVIVEREEEKDMKKLAQQIVGSVDLKKHPEWRNKKKITKWLRGLREKW